MQLLLFDDKNSWIDITDKFKIKVDYCTVKQQIKLESMLGAYAKKAEEISEEEQLQLFFEYATYYVKYHLKDWEGVTDGKKEIPFVLTNDEMDDKLWLGLVNNSDVFWKVFNAISNKLRFNAVDKKK